MQKIIVGAPDAGQRLDKFLQKFLKEAEKGFLYKMLRKKNITLNGAKADGSEKLAPGDELCFFFSRETFEKFRGVPSVVAGAGAASGLLPAEGKNAAGKPEGRPAALPDAKKLRVVFEDEQVLFADKPAGLLTQKAKPEDVSLCEHIEAYLAEEGAGGALAFSVGTANRLDRNTSGLVAAGKTLAGQQLLACLFRERLIDKYYYCIVSGLIEAPLHLKQYYLKDSRTNTARLLDELAEGAETAELEAFPAEALRDGFTLLKVKLITGRTHQIRAQLSAAGHPVLGDGKYGVPSVNQTFSARYGYPLRHQLLHAAEMSVPPFDAETAARSGLSEAAVSEWEALAGKTVTAPLPPNFSRCLRFLGGEVHGG